MEENYSSASDCFEKALTYDVNPDLEYVQDMVESYGYSLINSGQYENAMKLLNIYDIFSHTADFIFLIALIYMNNGMFEKAVEEFQKAAQMGECKLEGVNDYLAFYNIGVIYECLGNNAGAKDYYKKCNGYEPADQRLNRLK
jgi:tetratricopeptide (TPR) repeat protein